MSRKRGILFDVTYGKFKTGEVWGEVWEESCDVCGDVPTGDKCVYLFNRRFGLDL